MKVDFDDGNMFNENTQELLDYKIPGDECGLVTSKIGY